MDCKTTPYPWSKQWVARSPFKTLKRAKASKGQGFTARSSLKAMGRLRRSNGCYQLGPKYSLARSKKSKSKL